MKSEWESEELETARFAVKGAKKFRIWGQERRFSKDGRVLEQVYVLLGVTQEREGSLDLYNFEIHGRI